jgi:hypothetical protein
MVCESCWLVQTQDFANADEFFNATYAYFSSTSASWIEHAKRYCTDITARLGLGPKSSLPMTDICCEILWPQACLALALNPPPALLLQQKRKV